MTGHKSNSNLKLLISFKEIFTYFFPKKERKEEKKDGEAV